MVGTRKSQSKEDDGLLVSTGNSWKDKELRKLLIDGKGTLKGEARKESTQKVYHWRGAVYAVTEDTPQEWIDQEPDRFKRKSTQEATPQPPASAPRPSKKRSRDTEDDEPAKPNKKSRHSLPATLEPSQRPRRRSSTIVLSTKRPRRQSPQPVEGIEDGDNGRADDSAPPMFDISKEVGEMAQARAEQQRETAKSKGLQTEMLGEDGSEAPTQPRSSTKATSRTKTKPRSSTKAAPRTKSKQPTRSKESNPADSARSSSIREASGSINQDEADNFARTIVKLAKINSRIVKLQDGLDIDTLEAESVKDLRMKIRRAKQPKKRDRMKDAMRERRRDIADDNINLSSEWETTEMEEASEPDMIEELLNRTEDSLEPQDQDEEGGVQLEQEPPLEKAEDTAANTVTETTENDQNATSDTPPSDTPPSDTPPSLVRDGTTASSTMSFNTPPSNAANMSEVSLPPTNRGGQPLRWSLSKGIRDPDRAESLIYKGRLEGEGKAARRRRVAREMNIVKSWAKVSDSEPGDD